MNLYRIYFYPSDQAEEEEICYIVASGFGKAENAFLTLYTSADCIIFEQMEEGILDTSYLGNLIYDERTGYQCRINPLDFTTHLQTVLGSRPRPGNP